MTEREIFLEALELSTPEARAAYLETACVGNVALHRKVEELLKEHFSDDSLLARPAVEGKPTAVPELPGEDAPAQMLGRYKLLEKIGEGGFGEVWMAEQREPVKRRVALKIIKPGMDSRQIVARFEAERQALAMMDHANIARIFDADVTEAGRPYFVMELVRGVKVTEYCDQNELPTRERLKLFMLVCQAIQHAHQKGIIHRDIKPSNILVTLHDGVPVPKVIDFGIAKATQQELTDKTVFTHFQQFIGTPAYISPEQAEMSGLDIDTRADIYSLGVLLYELLVGQTPFDAKEMMQGGLDALRQIIREKEPLRPSTRLNTLSGDAKTTAGKRRQTDVGKLVHQVQGDLDWIVMKCLEKDRTRRYETANGLATDIQRHLANEPVLARPPSAAYKLQKAWQRNKVVFTAGAVVAVALLAGIGVSTWQAVVATQARGVAVHAQKAAETARQEAESSRQQESALRARAESAERATEQQLYIALLEQARATVLSGEVGQRVGALDAIKRAAAISNSAELRREAVAALALPDLRFERELPYGEDFIERTLDPLFERIALSRGRGPIEIRSVANQRLLATLPASTNLPTYVTEWSPDGRFLAVKRDYPGGGVRADWEIWETAKTQRVLLLRNVPQTAVCFHPHLQWLLAGDRRGVAIWDLESGGQVSRFQLPRTPDYVRFAPDGERFVVLHPPEPGGGGRFTVHAVANPSAPPLASNVFAARLVRVNWHPDGRWLAVADRSGDVHRIDAQTGETRLIGRHKSEARWTEFSPDGAYLMTGGWEREMICWDTSTLERAFTIRLGGYVSQFRGDGEAFAINTRSGVKLHAFARPSGYRAFAEDLGTLVQQAAFSADGRWLAASGNKRMGLWDLTTSGPGALEEEGHDTHCFFTPDGQQLFCSRRMDVKNDCFRWKITAANDAQEPPRLEPLPLRMPRGYTFVSLNSNSVVMTSTNGSQLLALDEVEAGKSAWKRTTFGLNRVSPDGRWMGISRHLSSSLYVHRLPGLEHVTTLKHLTNVHHFEFSPHGDEVALCSRAGVELYSTATWKRTCLLTNFDRSACLYTPDGRSLWLTTEWSAVGLYDARTLEPLLLLPTGMLPLAVSPDGRRLAVSVGMQRLELWDLKMLREQLRELGLDWRDDRLSRSVISNE